MTSVYVFHGTHSRFANAVFSTKELAEAWIARHALTGLLTGYTLDEPAFDRKLIDATLPKYVRTNATSNELRLRSIAAQTFTDGGVHFHYFYGVGENSPEYSDMSDKWDRDNSTT